MLWHFPHHDERRACELPGGPCRHIRPQELGDLTASVCTCPRDPNSKKPSEQGEVAARVGTESHPLWLAQRPDVGMRESGPEGCRGEGRRHQLKSPHAPEGATVSNPPAHGVSKEPPNPFPGSQPLIFSMAKGSQGCNPHPQPPPQREACAEQEAEKDRTLL